MCDVEMLMRLKQEKFSLLSPSTLKMPELLGTKMPDDGGGRTHEELVTNSSSKMSNSRPANQRGPARRQCNKERLMAYKMKMNPEFQFQEKSDVAEATPPSLSPGTLSDEYGGSTDEECVTNSSSKMSNSRPANQRGPKRRQQNKDRLIAHKKKENPDFKFQEKSDVAEATAEAAAAKAGLDLKGSQAKEAHAECIKCVKMATKEEKAARAELALLLEPAQGDTTYPHVHVGAPRFAMADAR